MKREVGVLVDPAPQPSLTIEVLNRTTGKLESFHEFPGAHRTVSALAATAASSSVVTSSSVTVP